MAGLWGVQLPLHHSTVGSHKVPDCVTLLLPCAGLRAVLVWRYGVMQRHLRLVGILLLSAVSTTLKRCCSCLANRATPGSPSTVLPQTWTLAPSNFPI